MSRLRTVTTGLVAAMLLLGVPLVLPRAAGDDALSGPHALDDGMQAARQALAAGKARKALPAFRELLEQHKGKDYAKARREEIEELILHLACGAKFKRPKVRDLLSGKLTKWSPASGKIRITYTPKTIGHLEVRDGFIHLPPRLNGPFTLEIKGSKYPGSTDTAPTIVLAGDQDAKTGKLQSWTMSLSKPQVTTGRRGLRVTGSIVHKDGETSKTLTERKASLGKPDRPYKIILKVSKTKIALTLAARSFGVGTKPPSLWGFLSFRAGDWTELKLTGTIEPTWIQSRLDEVFREQLAEFMKGRTANALAPTWLAEDLRREESKPDREGVDLLARLSSKHYDLFLDVDNDVRADEYEKALIGITGLQKAGVPEATCEWLRAQMRKRQTQLEKALVHLKRVTELEPEFLDAALMRGSLLRELGRYDEALATFQKAAGVYAQFPSAYEESASAMLFAGRPAAAKQITQTAARNGVYSQKLLTLNRALGKVVNGPRWQKRYEYKSQNYHVLSNMSASICRESAILLEEAFAEYRKKIGFVARDKARLFKVYIFSDQAGFMGYQGEIKEFMGKPTDKAAGLYSPLLKQLLIWNHADHQEVMNTVRHEGFHQYLDRVMPNPPVWLNEGLAVYHENGRKIEGKLTFGLNHPRYVHLLRGRGLIPLKKFLNSGPGIFYENGHQSYGEAWLLVHMLQHTTPEYLKLFETLMTGLKKGSAFEVVSKAFPDTLIPKLEKDMHQYLEKLANG